MSNNTCVCGNLCHCCDHYFFRVPILLEGMIKLIKVQLDIKPRGKVRLMRKWHDLAETYDRIYQPVSVTMVTVSAG